MRYYVEATFPDTITLRKVPPRRKPKYRATKSGDKDCVVAIFFSPRKMCTPIAKFQADELAQNLLS